MKPKPIKTVSKQMTNEPEMTLSQAQAWARANWASETFDRWTYIEAKGFLAGHAAASKEAEVYKAALEKIVDPECLSISNTAREIAQEALSKGRTM